MQNTGSYRLIVRRGPQPNQVHELTRESISLGRDITNDIVINDPEVSRHHGKIARTPSGYTLEDLGSTNGTFINGQRLTGSRPLLGGEMIGLGETVTLSYDVSAVSAPVNQPSYVPPAPSYAPPAYQPPGEPIPAAPDQSQPPPTQQPAYSPYAPPASTPPIPSFVEAAPGYAPMTPQVTSAPPLNPPGQMNTFTGPPPTPFVPADAPAQYTPVPYAPAPNNPYPVNTAPPAPVNVSPYPPLPEAPPQNSSLRWILLGCGILILLCVVFSVAGLLYIDANNLYCKLPIVRQIVGVISSQCAVSP